MRRVVDDLRRPCRHEFVAGAHFLRCARQHHGRRVTVALESRGAEVDCLVRKRLVGIRIDQRGAAPVDIPAFLIRAGNAAYVSAVSSRQNDPIALRADDGRRLVEAVGLDHQGAGEERLDNRGGNARDALFCERLAADSRTELL